MIVLEPLLSIAFPSNRALDQHPDSQSEIRPESAHDIPPPKEQASTGTIATNACRRLVSA